MWFRRLIASLRAFWYSLYPPRHPSAKASPSPVSRGCGACGQLRRDGWDGYHNCPRLTHTHTDRAYSGWMRSTVRSNTRDQRDTWPDMCN